MLRKLIIFLLIFSPKYINAQNYQDYYFDGRIKSEGDTAEGKKTGFWSEYFESGELKSQGSYLEGKKYGYWATYSRIGKVVIISYWEDDKKPHEFYFHKQISVDDLKFLMQFEEEFFRLVNEILKAKVVNNVLSFPHTPTIYIDLENEFQRLVKKDISRATLLYYLSLFHKKWYLKHFTENYYECELTQVDELDRITEKIYIKDGKQIKRIVNTYYKRKKDHRIYIQCIAEEEMLYYCKRFITADTTTYEIIYYTPEEGIHSKGYYKNGLKAGTWNYYDGSGKLIRTEKYKDGTLKE